MQVLAIFTTALGKHRACDLLHVPVGRSVVVTGRLSHIMASQKTGGKIATQYNWQRQISRAAHYPSDHSAF
jgi:hypothetical protein